MKHLHTSLLVDADELDNIRVRTQRVPRDLVVLHIGEDFTLQSYNVTPVEFVKALYRLADRVREAVA